MVRSLFQVGAAFVCVVISAHAESEGVVRLLDFPLSGECAEPIPLQPANATEDANGCSPLNVVGCSGALISIIAACGGPEDLPCIGAALSLIAGCHGCVCALIGYDCAVMSNSSELPTVEFGTCSEAGFPVAQETQVIKQGGFDVALNIHSKSEEVGKLHLLDAPAKGFCTEMSAGDESLLPSDTIRGGGSCSDAGFSQFDSFQTLQSPLGASLPVEVFDANIVTTVRLLDFPSEGECAEPEELEPPRATEVANGCNPLNKVGCGAALIGIIAACGGPEDLPCIGAALSLIAGCGPCVCTLIGFECAVMSNSSELPTVEFGTCSEAGFPVEQETQVIKQGGFDVALHIHSRSALLVV